MSKHKRYFPVITADAFAGLLAMYATKSEATAEVLRLYAVDGIEPEEIAKVKDLDLGNVLRIARRAGQLLAMARVACNAVQRPMKMGPMDLRAWLERNRYSAAEGAKELGVTNSSMERMLNESTFLPRSIALACAAVEAGLEK